jgi:hypothetical protein
MMERGLAAGTVVDYAHAVRPFVASVGGDGELDLQKLTAADVTAFVVARCPRRTPTWHSRKQRSQGPHRRTPLPVATGCVRKSCGVHAASASAGWSRSVILVRTRFRSARVNGHWNGRATLR